MKKYLTVLCAVAAALFFCSCSNGIGNFGNNRTYKVNHYFENLENEEYTLDKSLSQKLSGIAGEETAAEAYSITGFIPKEFEQQVLEGKNTVISIYYDRARTTITFDGNGGTTQKVNEEGEEEAVGEIVIEGKYEQTFSIPEFSNFGYKFKEWACEIPEYFGENDLVIKALWEPELGGKTTYAYLIHPVKEYVYARSTTYTISPVFDIRRGMNQGNPLIIWTAKPRKDPGSLNQWYFFEPTSLGDDIYKIFVSDGSGTKYYLTQGSPSISTYPPANGPYSVYRKNFVLARASNGIMNIQLIPVKREDKSNQILYMMKVYGTDFYVTSGPSVNNGVNFSPDNFSTGYTDYEAIVYYTTLKTDENGDVDDTQLFIFDCNKEFSPM